MSRKPPIGEANLGALIGAVVGSIGGLFALGIAPAVIYGKPYFLAAAPKLNVISFFFCGVVAWFAGGQLGPRLEPFFGQRNGLIIGGIIAGLIPVCGIATLGWYLAAH